MADLKSQFKNIETVDDYLKFKDNLTKTGPSNGAKPIGAYQDFFEESDLKAIKKPNSSNEADILRMMRPNNYQEYGNNNNNYNNYNNNNNFLLNDSLIFKENMIPRDLKEDPIKRNDGFSNGGLVSNESMIDTSILNMLNVRKTGGVKDLIEVNPTHNVQPLAEKKNSGSDFGLKGLLSDVDKLLNRVGGGSSSNVASSLNNRHELNLNLPPLSSSNSSNTASSVYQKLKINERPDLKPNYIDNNDVRSYLNSLNIKVPPKNEAKAPQEEKSETISSKKSDKNHKKAKKNNSTKLSIIEDDMEGEEEENFHNKKSHRHTKKHGKQKKRPDSENSSHSSHSRKRKKEDIKYEEDLTSNISENNISLQSANHFNEKYLQSRRKYSKSKDYENNLSIISETSLPPKRNDMTQEEYLKKKYRKNRNGEDKLDLKFLDEISDVLCVNCESFIHFKEADEHSKSCNESNNRKRQNANETVDSINGKIKTLHSLLKYKLKKLKDHFKNEVKHHENLFNNSVMTLDCIEQIISNNSNIYTLVSNIKDLNMFNKCINEGNDEYKKVVLEVTYRFKPLIKLKIKTINPKNTWEELKNLREKSIINSSDQSILRNSIFSNFDKSSKQNLSLNKSILECSFLKNKSFTSQNPSQANSFIGSSRIQNPASQKDVRLKEFMRIGVDLKLELDRDHPGRSFDLKEGFMEAEGYGLKREEWARFLKDKFAELVIF